MKRELVEKAVERIERYMIEGLEESMARLVLSGFKGSTKKAWIRACEELELDELDKGSRMWFIEDDEEFEAAYAEVLEDLEKGRRFNELYCNYLFEMEDDEDD